MISPKLPVQEILLELFIGNVDPSLNELFSFFSRNERRQGEIPFDLGDVRLLAGGIHEEIDGIQHRQLEGQLLMFLDVVVSIVLCAIADLFGRPMSAVGQYIPYPFSPNNPVK